MMRLTLGIAAKAFFGADVEDDAHGLGGAFEAVLASSDARSKSLFPLPESVQTPSNLRRCRALRRLDSIIYRIIAERRASGDERGDLLSMLLTARDRNARCRMTARQLRDEMMALSLTGHETTSLALTWTWYLLAQHREVE